MISGQGGAAATGNIFKVEYPYGPDDDVNLKVLFYDWAAHDLDDLIWDCTAFIDMLPAVEETVREDRELILVTGAIGIEALTAETHRVVERTRELSSAPPPT